MLDETMMDHRLGVQVSHGRHAQINVQTTVNNVFVPFQRKYSDVIINIYNKRVIIN